jgi:hypothetical protein
MVGNPVVNKKLNTQLATGEIEIQIYTLVADNFLFFQPENFNLSTAFSQGASKKPLSCVSNIEMSPLITKLKCPLLGGEGHERGHSLEP